MSRRNYQKLLNAGTLASSFLFTAVAIAQPTSVSAMAPENQGQTAPPEQWTAPPPSAAAPTQPSTPAGSPPPSQAAPADSAPKPKIQLAEQAPPPAPVVARTDKTHDGFYTRVAVGFASQSTTIDDGEPAPNFEATTGALVVSALIGGSPAPGLVIGGALGLDNLPSTTFTADNYQAKTGMNLFSIGPFIDGYPNPRGGFHLGGTIGPAFARLNNNTGFASSKSNGLSLAAWLGYDWWVADQWSVGGMLRFSGANTWSSKNSADLGIDMRSIALLFTAVYQ